MISRKAAKGAKVRRNKYPGLSLRAWRPFDFAQDMLGAINPCFELFSGSNFGFLPYNPYWTKVQYTSVLDPWYGLLKSVLIRRK